MKYIILMLMLGILHPASCKKLNVLFLVSDDMRPEIGAYKGGDFPSPIHPNMHTPYLDELASKSLLLKRAYVQQAVCAPSRTSLLTGGSLFYRIWFFPKFPTPYPVIPLCIPEIMDELEPKSADKRELCPTS